VNIHSVMGDIAADILRPARMRTCGVCRDGIGTVYVTWYLPIDGQVTDGGGAYLCAECQNKLELSGAKIVYK
jgi:hypothetical protein